MKIFQEECYHRSSNVMNGYYSEPNTPQLLIGRTLAEVPERLMLPFIRNRSLRLLLFAIS